MGEWPDDEDLENPMVSADDVEVISDFYEQLQLLSEALMRQHPARWCTDVRVSPAYL